jgi:7-keto-8-aminopelargonate synthetase-like enzyme
VDREHARTLNLADFYPGHDEDPLQAPADFLQWRAATVPEQGLFQRPQGAAAGPHAVFHLEGCRRKVINLASLDYLGLNGHPAIVAAAREALDTWGTGACGVPLLSGTTELHVALEAAVSESLGRPSTTLFASGFSGGVGLMSGLLRRGDVAIADEKTHICWLEGIRAAGAKLVLFPHQDVQALDRALDAHRASRRVVVVDGLYSMDGDIANLPAIADACDAHGVGLVVDEAHSIFALGKSGGGATELCGVRERVRLLFGTFSKAVASLGGFVSGPRDLLDYARFYAHPFGFSAALPPHVVAANIAAVRVSSQEPERRQRLADSARYFRDALKTMGIDTGLSSTHVVPILVGGERDLLYDAAREMLTRGLYLLPIEYPAVPADGARFRAALSAAHERADLDAALTIIEDCVAAPLRRRGKLHDAG